MIKDEREIKVGEYKKSPHQPIEVQESIQAEILNVNSLDTSFVPFLRFKDFIKNFGWQEKTLGELEDEGSVSLSRGKVISKSEMRANPGSYPVYSSSVLKNGLMGNYGLFMFDEELISWSVDGGGHFFYRPKHKFSITNVSGIMKVTSENINTKFLYYQLSMLHSKEKFDYLSKAHPSVIRTIYNISVPSLPEQKKIAEFFTLLDRRIELQADKIEALREYKKGVQQKIFNRELVFTDDNGDAYPEWEEKTLGDALHLPINEKVPINEIDRNKILTVRLHLKGICPNTRTASLKIGATQYYKRNAGQFIFGRQELHHGALGIIPKELDGYLSSMFLPVLDINSKIVDSSYLIQYISRKEFYAGLEKITTGTRKSKLMSEKDLLKVKISLPSIPEQEKIASLLSAIDSKVDKENEKLEALREQKKGYLQKMFV